MRESEYILECRGISKYFGSLAALDDLSFKVAKGTIFGIAGPNGAGKTTLFNCISGLTPPDSGQIAFDGKNIEGLRSHEICHLGIARTFQIPDSFSSLTPYQNVSIGLFFGKRSHGDIHKEAMDILDFTALLDKKDAPSKSLSLYEKKLLMMAIALSTNCRLLLLDEPISGLNREEVEKVLKTVRMLNERGITIIWIEHIMKAIMRVCDRILILANGKKLAEGTSSEIAENERVIEIYLGKRYI